jgi:hypothetical protein
MKWDIVEPEAEKVDFTKAMKAYTKGKQIGSVVSKSKFSIKFEEYIDEVTDEEIDGEWIIED